MMQAPKQILIVRPSAIGDIAMASAMLAPLKTGFPGVRIAWLVEPQLREVLADNPLVDELVVWPKAEWRRLGRELRWLQLVRDLLALRRKLRGRFDLALDAQGLLRSRLLAWLSGARERIGFASSEPGAFLLTRVISRGGNIKLMSSEYRHMICELGLEPGPFHPSLEVADVDAAAASDALKLAGVGKRYAVFAPFTTRPQKHWFDERWVELARKVKDEFGLTTVVLGGPDDSDRADAMCSAAGKALVHLAGKVRLAVSMAVLQGAQLVVGVDTGLTHMGPAFDRPTVALFGATCPYLETSRSNTRVLYHRRDCSPCKRRPTCDSRFDCMRDLVPDEVMMMLKELLAGDVTQ
jgi:heptosyltransferase-1